MPITVPTVDQEQLRCEIRREYREVALHAEKGFHFHTGRSLARILGYDQSVLDQIPESSVESMAGTGNPFAVGELREGEKVVDIGCGAGIDSLVAALKVGPAGKVVGVDLTPEMVAKARLGAAQIGLKNVDFRIGFAETLPVPDNWADVIISNGVVNLVPDKRGLFKEMLRVLKPGGRLQIGDIIVQEEVPQESIDDIDLWTG
jgi:arsenite methyltransferase